MLGRNAPAGLAGIAILALVLALPAALAETAHKTYKVKGFTCSGCASSLEKALKAKKGVIDARANFAEGKVDVAFDREVITEREIEKAIVKAGFSVVKPDSSGSPDSRRKGSS